MSARDKLYDINNQTIKKSVNIDDSLYKQIIYLTRNKFCSTVSEIVNICIEEYVEKNSPSYYEKPKMESVTYRSIMIRENNLKELQKMNKKTGITVTRLLNASIKEFLESL